MQTINAPSLEEAIIKASSVLGCSVVDLEYEVIQAPSKGFLGLGKKEAILRVQRKPQAPINPQPTPAPSKRKPMACSLKPPHHSHKPQPPSKAHSRSPKPTTHKQVSPNPSRAREFV
ncbi:hypothetical protein NHP190003_05560 [Helicobacter sp. NHP19-003]|uniref:RNA-binding protein KhpB N-terminal domain-containing protein n=1 Tax=Helicobacter gastrocanis TaxID=2849641 RepID=A0ABM7SHR6_9HELI|nr:hypothetical protein NHP190003_05560 [Helicobacter sp. NHP19-003]